MTPREFVRKWKAVELRERQAAQEHFLDLCELVGQDKPAAVDPKGEFFCFERGAEKRGGEDGWADVWKKGYFGWEYKGKHKDLEAAWKQLDEYRADLENPPLLVTCDTGRFEIHTSFQNSPHVVHRIGLDELLQPEKLDYLRAVFFDPDKLRPGRISRVVTQDAARVLGDLAQALRERKLDPRRVARFLDRVVFCLFAEDIGMLREEVLTKLLDRARHVPGTFPAMSAELFSRMATGGSFGWVTIPHVNGRLFDDAETIELTHKELELLWQAARLDWSAIDPSIFGTLFVRGMDPSKRAQLGAQYTSREDIETLVEPVVMAPLRRDWEEKRELVRRLLATGQKSPGAELPKRPLSGSALAKARREAWEILDSFLGRLERIRILDPACGSGNFLYVALRKIKDLELQATDFVLDQGLTAPVHIGFGPWQLFGIEKDVYAHELAQMTVWIGYLQWLWQHGTTTWKEPILQAMSNIECKDAILDLADPSSPKEPDWPRVDFIIGNPPFLGGKLLRRELGDPYVDGLFGIWSDRVPREADLCTYWFEKARQAIASRGASRAGLLATQAIRGGVNRRVLERIKETGDIYWAISDQEWVLDGAAVHVSIVGFDAGVDSTRSLDLRAVEEIHSDLRSGVDLTRAKRLDQGERRCFMGMTPAGAFQLSLEEAISLLHAPNPNGRPSSDVIYPYVNGSDLFKRPKSVWIVDLFGLDQPSAARYEAAYEIVRERVLPVRSKNRRERYSSRWWVFAEAREGFRARRAELHRYLVLTRHAANLIFAWVGSEFLPDSALFAFVPGTDTNFGLLQSVVHRVWAFAKGTQVRDRESGFRYTPSECLETFAFPSMNEEQEKRVESAARLLEEERSRWLNPAEWTKEVALEFPASFDGPWKRFVTGADSRGIGTARWPRVIPKDAECAKKLTKRTLTNLYNERPAWLVNAHQKLDEAVLRAYGWPLDLSEEQILERLLDLNLERADRS